ncbi:MAG: LacI family DNA-binding transcriptional regulator [Bacilli bacterium]
MIVIRGKQMNQDSGKKDRVTIYEVARLSGVSLATVSRVMNGSASVSKVTKDKVQAVIKRLGYKPSGLAQGLATSKSTTIAVVVPSANYVYISNFINGIQLVARQHGYNVMLFFTSHSNSDARDVIEEVIKAHVDGAIVFDDELSSEDIRSINDYSVPVIVINHKVTGDQVGCVVFNHQEVLEQIIKENAEKNGKKMTFVHILNGGRLVNRVERTFIETHQALLKEYDVVNCDDSYIHTYEEFKTYFTTHKTGYFIAYRDSISASIINAALDSGLRIPEDVEVISLVGTKYSHIIRPNISALYINFSEVGKCAVTMLVSLFDGKLSNKVMVFIPEFIKQDTTVNSL